MKFYLYQLYDRGLVKWVVCEGLSKEQLEYNIVYIIRKSKDLKEAEEGIIKFLEKHAKNSWLI